MSATVEDPTTVPELLRYVEREHPRLSTSFNGDCEQVVVVGQPGKPEPPAALREVLGRDCFELRAQAVTDRKRWVGVVNVADDGANMTDDDTVIRTCPVCLGPLEDADDQYCNECQPNSGWNE